MLTLAQLMSRVAERKGYTIQGSDQGALLAKKGDERLLVAWNPEGSVTTADASLFLAALEQVHAERGILIAPKGADQGAKDVLASIKNVEVWAESRLVVEVGEALVKLALEETAAPAPASLPAAGPAAPPATQRAATASRSDSLLSRAVASTGNTHNPGAVIYMPSKATRQVAGAGGAIHQQKSGALGYAWGGATGAASSPGVAQVRNGRRAPVESAAPAPSATMVASDDVEIISTPKKRPAPAAEAAPAAPIMAPQEDSGAEILGTSRKAPAPPPAPAAPASLSATMPTPEPAPVARPAPVSTPLPANGCTTLKQRLGRDEAFAKAQAKGAANARLVLIPHVAFEYDVCMQRPNMTTPVTGRGAVLVSSLTGTVRNVDRLDFAEADPTDARKENVKLQAVDLYDKVKGFMTKTFSRSVNTEREVAGNTVMETLKLVPDPDEMGLQHKGIVYVPCWESVASDGAVRVDAYVGEKC